MDWRILSCSPGFQTGYFSVLLGDSRDWTSGVLWEILLVARCTHLGLLRVLLPLPLPYKPIDKGEDLLLRTSFCLELAMSSIQNLQTRVSCVHYCFSIWNWLPSETCGLLMSWFFWSLHLLSKLLTTTTANYSQISLEIFHAHSHKKELHRSPLKVLRQK